VIEEFASLCKSYRISKIEGDRYAGEFPRQQFRKCGIEYRCSDKTKSDLFRDLLPMLNAGRVTLPKSERLVNQLCGLERRVARSGKDSIDHGTGSHDVWCGCRSQNRDRRRTEDGHCAFGNAGGHREGGFADDAETYRKLTGRAA
jgi:hypothetical protein